MRKKTEETFSNPVILDRKLPTALHGFITIGKDGAGIENFRIISKVGATSHFVILKYGKSSIDANRVFNLLNYKYNLGETWFLETPDGFIYTISFRIYKWEVYKKMLFSMGINMDFRRASLREKYGSLVVHDAECHFMFKCFEDKFLSNEMYRIMKGNLSQILFGVCSVDDINK